MVRETKGITLIALALTIVVILILSTVSINAIFSRQGMLKQAEQTRELQSNIEQHEDEKNNNLSDQYNNMLAQTQGLPKGPNGKVLVTALTEKQEITIEAEDKNGNKVVVPGGFKVRSDIGKTVQDGIVIEDIIGNQFVWIPVSNINGDGSNEIVKNDGSKIEITLGRYTFASNSASTPGKPTIIQKGSEYADKNVNNKYTIESLFEELNVERISNGSAAVGGTNTTAKDLKRFVESVEKNNGYYLARYEASFGSGDTSATITNQKPYSIESKKYSVTAMTYEKGTLWNFIKQPDAAKVCKNMYANDTYIESDLTNSYAWDTAIVYIQNCSNNSNYSNANRETVGNTNLLNTGETRDKVCNIYDMASNLLEWTTEYTKYTADDNVVYPWNSRGGAYNLNSNNNCVKSRHSHYPSTSGGGVSVSFRPIIYCK